MRMQRFEVAERFDEQVELARPELASHARLRTAPMRRRFAQRALACRRERDLARARVAAAHRGDEPACDERIEVARQRGAIEQRARREPADLLLAFARERTQE